MIPHAAEIAEVTKRMAAKRIESNGEATSIDLFPRQLLSKYNTIPRAGAVSVIVYEWVDLGFLRRAWINFDALWTVALIGVGTVLLAGYP